MHRTLRILLLTALVALPLEALQAAAGNFISVVGDVRVVGTDGRQRAAERGSGVDSGETVITADGGFAQLTMADGSRLQVREDSELKLDDYVFEEQEQGAGRMFMSLLRGTMRSLTGLIGKRRKENYSVRTPHATIGIRGTDHQVTVLLQAREGFQPGTFDVVFTGGTVMQTNAGRIDVAPRQAGYVTSRSAVPRVIRIPTFLQENAARSVPTRPGVTQTRRAGTPADGNKADTGPPTRAIRPALRTPLSSPLRTPLSDTTTRTLSTDGTTTLERSTTTLESYKLEDSSRLLTSPTLDSSTSTTTTRDLSTTTTTVSPTKTLSPTTSSTLTSPTRTLSPTLTAPTTTTDPIKTISPTTTTEPIKTISPTTTLQTEPILRK